MHWSFDTFFHIEIYEFNCETAKERVKGRRREPSEFKKNFCIPQYIFYRHDTKRTLDMSRTSKTAHMASGAVRPSLKCMFLIKLSRFLVHNLIKITKVESMHEKLERLQMMPALVSNSIVRFHCCVTSKTNLSSFLPLQHSSKSDIVSFSSDLIDK